MKPVSVLCLALLTVAFADSAWAQEPLRNPPAAFDSIEVVTGIMDFDIAGTGQTMPFGVRFSKALTNHLALEVGTTFAVPEQQFGRSTMNIPEAQLSYSWRLGRVRPFVSGGAGVGLFSTSAVPINWWWPTFSTGGGARIQLNDTLHAVGEMRVRGISRNFSSSTAEWLGGIGCTFK